MEPPFLSPATFQSFCKKKDAEQKEKKIYIYILLLPAFELENSSPGDPDESPEAPSSSDPRAKREFSLICTLIADKKDRIKGGGEMSNFWGVAR